MNKTPREAVDEYFPIEAMGFDTSDVCMIPDCGCDGESHE